MNEDDAPAGPPRERPLVWYVAAGYNLPAGVEVYLLHYATELRRQGFDTRLVVFDRLPQKKHWCLQALEDRHIPIRSLYDETAGRARRRAAVTWPLARTRARLRGGPAPSFAAWERWWLKRESVRRLGRLIASERPDIVHVKGRVIAEAWPALPPERSVFHVATAGKRDESWTDAETQALRTFASRAARVFAPGSGVAENFRREFGVDRKVDVLFTMVPDEGGQRSEVRGQRSEVGGQRSEVGGQRSEVRGQTTEVRGQSSDLRSPISDLRPRTSDLGPRISDLRPPAPGRRFGFLGRLHEEKGIRPLLDALKALQVAGLNVPFLFAGDGPMGDEIREGARREGLDSVRIEPVARPVDSIAQMDVLVLPSRSEAMPVAIVEAFMCGRPCIATAVGGITDLVRDGVEGFLILPGSPESLAAAIRRFASMPADEFGGFARRARSRYEACCTPETVSVQVAACYGQIMAALPGNKRVN